MTASTASGPSRKQMIMFLAVPISVLVLAIGFLTIPSRLAQPNYNFVFSACPSYSCINDFTVDANGFISEEFGPNYIRDRSELYLYDVSSDSYRPLTLAQSKSLQLDPSSVAPDGYRVQYKSEQYGGLFFGGSSEQGWIIKKGYRVRDLILPGRYEHGIKFLAWEVS